MKKKVLLVLVVLQGLSGCAFFGPPNNPDDICEIFDQKWGWKGDARRAERRWGSPVPVMMAIMYQESAFEDAARPPRVRFLGIPLWWRQSSAYGYAQAKDETWRWYESSVGRDGDRDDFDDAIDFIGWYNGVSRRELGLSSTDAYSLYLAYHEGHGGYRSGSYRGKDWLLQAASRVRDRAAMYSVQWQRCD
jgi:hypothetical protein